MMRAERSIRQAAQTHAGVPLLTLERLTFRFVEAGFVLLSATLLVGWLFAETLYGPGLGWKWDHKTDFFAAGLGRLRRPADRAAHAWAGAACKPCACCTSAPRCCC